MTTRHLTLAMTLMLAAGCVPDPGKAAGLPGPLPTAATATPSDPITPLPSATPTAAPQTSASPTPSPSATVAASPAPSVTPTPSATPTASPSPSPSVSATPKPPTIHTLTINAQASQSLTLPTSSSLELEARIEAVSVTGIAACLRVYVNNQAIRQSVTNRSMRTLFASGQETNLFNTDANAWSVLYSPDFTQANSGAADAYQVTSDPGQAYRYVWNVADQKGTGATMTVRLENQGQGAQQQPVFAKVYQR